MLVVLVVLVVLVEVPLVRDVVLPPMANGGDGYPGHSDDAELVQLGVRLAHCALTPNDGASGVSEALDDEGTITARSDALLRVTTESAVELLAATRSPDWVTQGDLNAQPAVSLRHALGLVQTDSLKATPNETLGTVLSKVPCIMEEAP
jgi:hypothetical protein